MKLSFKTISIRIKIIILIVSISIISLLLSAVFFFIYDRKEFREKTKRDLMVLAQVIGSNNSGALVFDDKITAQEFLNTLKAESEIKQALLFKDTIIFAEYIKDSTANYPEVQIKNFPKSGYLFTSKDLKILYNIKFAEKSIGYIYLYSELEGYKARFSNFLSFISLLILYSILIVLVLSLIMQNVISKPIINLAKAMQHISQTRDFSIRSTQKSKDEIGDLTVGFNKMLEEIERQNIELVKAKEKAEKADNLKSLFLSNMSHEIRTPLNAIIGFSDLVSSKNLTDKDREEYMYYISSSSKMLLQLINDIIDVAKIEAGQLKINKNDCSVSTIVKELHLSFSKDLINKNKKEVEMKLSIPDRDVVIYSDQFRIKQIFSNLINNAIKFTEQGYIEIGYYIVENKYLECYVKDTGMGIEKEKQQMIFERFKQARAADTYHHGGTGLGLSICRNLAEILGGKIWVISETGAGSTFFFTLPL